MKIKWQWFLGGQTMFWIASILLLVLVFSIVVTYIIDPTTSIYMKVQSIDETIIIDTKRREKKDNNGKI